MQRPFTTGSPHHRPCDIEVRRLGDLPDQASPQDGLQLGQLFATTVKPRDHQRLAEQR